MPPPSREECLKNWPAFRGFLGSGISPYDNVPTRWDVKTGEGIVWKSPVPLEGNSSPVIWNDRLFLTGATRDKRQVYCYDTATGKLLWQQDVPGTPAGDLKLNELTGFASPTPATDGRHVYVSFATGDLAAFNMAGNLIWKRSLGIPKNHYGHASSLRVWQDKLIVQFDQGTDKEELLRLLALDTLTGKTVWEAKRPNIPVSWSTPIVIEVNGQAPSPQPLSPGAGERGRGEGPQEQIITCGDPWVIAYNPTDGQELWRAKCLRGEVGPSPVFAGGIVYPAVEYEAASAVRANGKGDVTATHIIWSLKDPDVPDMCSPLVAGSNFYFLTSFGARLNCCAIASGDKKWVAEIESQFRASPSMAGKFIYLFGADEEGKAFVLEPAPPEAKIILGRTQLTIQTIAAQTLGPGGVPLGPAIQLVTAAPVAEIDAIPPAIAFTTSMGEKISACPAFQDGRIYVRGQKELFCIGKK